MSANYLIDLYEHNNTTLIKKTAITAVLIYQSFDIRHQTS